MDESEDGRIGLLGSCELVQHGERSEHELGWVASDAFWIRSGDLTAWTWDRRGWIEQAGRYENASHVSLGPPLCELLELSSAQRLGLVRAGHRHGHLVTWEHGPTSGTLDLALGVVVAFDSPDTSYRAHLAIADVHPPRLPWAGLGATFVALEEPKPFAGRWEGSLHLTLLSAAPGNADADLVPTWDEVLAASRDGRVEIHDHLTSAFLDVSDLLGATMKVPQGLPLDEAISWLRGAGCGQIRIAVDTPDDERHWFVDQDGTVVAGAPDDW